MSGEERRGEGTLGEGVGRRRWAFPGGRIPLRSTGEEPESTSRDELCVLNAGDVDAELELRIFYEEREPAGPFRLRVAARRVRHVRINDLIDPEPVPLDVAYAALIEASEPVVVMFLRKDTSQGANALLGSLAYAE